MTFLGIPEFRFDIVNPQNFQQIANQPVCADDQVTYLLESDHLHFFKL